jgi:DNA-binding beta-propeller fold protein YncE
MSRYLTIAAILTAALPSIAAAQTAPASGPYHVTATAKVGGEGGWDYVYADSVGRKLYIPRSGQAPTPRITVYDLDSLKPLGTIPGFNAHGVAVDPKSHHGFATSKPVAMFDSDTLAPIKTIETQGNPDGILFDPYNQHVYIWSHAAPNATVINAVDGSIVGTIDLGGPPEQAATDGQGHIYVDIEDKGQVAVVDAKTLAVTAKYDVSSKTTGLAGLALDAKNHILFVAGRTPAVMVVLNANDGKIITTLPIGVGTDGAGFNPATMEAFASTGDGVLTVVKEKSPTDFAVEQSLPTMSGARTMTVDAKTGKVFVITAEFGPPPPEPPPAAGAPTAPAGPPRIRRGPMIPDSFSILAIGK